jgi:fumarate reductase subunit C
MQTTATHSRAGTAPAYPWRQPGNWYLKNKRYFAYMVRELTAVFAALWVIMFLIQIPAMGAGAQNLVAHGSWLYFVHSTEWVLFSVIAFFFVGYHAITWFKLMGTVMWMRFSREPVPAKLIVTTMFLAWAAVSVIIAFFIATPIIGS